MRHKQGYVIIACAVGVVVALSGCTAPAAHAVKLPPKNEAKWVLPLDEFTYTSAPLRDYAEALVERDCYAKKGVDWPVPWQPTDRGLGASFSQGGQIILNADLASRYGYHRAPVTYKDAAEWKAFTVKANEIADKTAGFSAIMDACQAESRKVLPLPSNDSRDYAIAAASQIFSEAVLSTKVTEAVSRWAQCMSKSGYGGMAGSPADMPSDNKAEAWSVGIPGTTAGPEETAVASADVACRTSSGWTTALYDEQWTRQDKFINANSDRLIRIRDEFAKERKTLLKAVADHAPKRAG